MARTIIMTGHKQARRRLRQTQEEHGDEFSIEQKEKGKGKEIVERKKGNKIRSSRK
jgi:hypothetical protein